LVGWLAGWLAGWLWFVGGGFFWVGILPVWLGWEVGRREQVMAIDVARGGPDYGSYGFCVAVIGIVLSFPRCGFLVELF
jgi:hypothetical protein